MLKRPGTAAPESVRTWNVTRVAYMYMHTRVAVSAGVIGKRKVPSSAPRASSHSKLS